MKNIRMGLILLLLLILLNHLLTLVTGIHAGLCTSCPGCL